MRKAAISLLVLLGCFACSNNAENASQFDTEIAVASPVDTTPVEVIEPVAPPPDYDTTLWTEVIRLDSSFVLDLRYATDSNFVGEQMYECGRCFLRPAAAHSLAKVQDSLEKRGLGLKLFDCYRPLPVQWRLWNKVPDRRYVADPRKGSQHNKGVAVDLTIIDLASGEVLDMGTAYDYFGGEAWHRATVGFGEPIRGNRELILAVMEGFGWKRTNSEWWHYSYPMSRVEAPIDSMEWKCVGI
jgi:D-alanyl-D-alanine dipeptidase